MSRNPNLIELAGQKEGVVEVDSFKKSVSIYKCGGEKNEYGRVEIKGKCNSVLIDNCAVLEVHVDSVMSTVEVSNCKRLKLILKPGAAVLS